MFALITMWHPRLIRGIRVAHIFSFLCCVFVLFVLVLYPMLQVFLNCLFWTSPSVSSNIYLHLPSFAFTTVRHIISYSDWFGQHIGTSTVFICGFNNVTY